ncbi:MAG TPA: hypothetical protein VFU46_10990 [Gemmatimonadales bacterium]|nr:hypothetical protein [Gemmatimonadales bacterium]
MRGTSSPEDAPTEPPRARTEAGAEPRSGPRQKAVLPRELADFLVEFSIVLHNRSMYPDGHPQLRNATERFVHRLESLLQSRGSLALGIAHRHLLVESVATDPRNALLRDLAVRLHRHQLTSIRFEAGITLGEVDDVLGALSADPLRGEGPLGRRLAQISHWEHLQLAPVDYDRFALREEPLNPQENTREADELWVALAQLALGTSEPDAPMVAQAIESQTGEVAYDRVVLDYLTRIAEEMSGRVSPAEDRLRQRVSTLIANFEPGTLRRLLEAGADQEVVRQFTLNASQVLAVDAVVQVLEAAADVSQQTISHHLLRLLHKLAHHAEHGDDQRRTEADGALRQNVARLVSGWQLADPNPGGYTAILDGMVRDRTWDFALPSSAEAEPEGILQMALEIGCTGPRAVAAVDVLLSRGRFGRLLEILRAAPRGAATDFVWGRVVTPNRLATVLQTQPLDRELARMFVAQLGPAAIEPLLDHLATTPDRPARAWLLRILADFDQAAAEAAAARLPAAEWYVQRNLMTLLQRTASWPEHFTPLDYATHPHPIVRREAFKLALGRAELRAPALLAALQDPDERVLLLALAAAQQAYSRDAVPVLERIAADSERDPELCARAARALGRVPPSPRSPLAGSLAAYWGQARAGARTLALAIWRPVHAYASAARQRRM